MHPLGVDSSVIIEAPCSSATRGGRFGWDRLHKDGCAMAAAVLLWPGGTAAFAATVAGAAPGDAWVIWHVDLLDADGFVLGSLATEDPVGGDWRKFLLPMPWPGMRYRREGRATFDAGLWPVLRRLKLYASVARGTRPSPASPVRPCPR
nr:hypothetical protein GCM10020063_060180 [Dactylosporangium thailandense]